MWDTETVLWPTLPIFILDVERKVNIILKNREYLLLYSILFDLKHILLQLI